VFHSTSLSGNTISRASTDGRYRRSEHALRIAIFFSMATFAGAFGGLLAYGIGFMKNIGGFKNGWHWIFILGLSSYTCR